MPISRDSMKNENGFRRMREAVGARGRNRTGTARGPRDFKSLASTSFATRAEWLFRVLLKDLEAETGIEPMSTALQAAA